MLASVQPRTSPLKFAASRFRCFRVEGLGGAPVRRRKRDEPAELGAAREEGKKLHNARSRLYRSRCLQPKQFLTFAALPPNHPFDECSAWREVSASAMNIPHLLNRDHCVSIIGLSVGAGCGTPQPVCALGSTAAARADGTGCPPPQRRKWWVGRFRARDA